MARQIWSGSLSFGLVNVPVGLISATEKKDVAFHQREKGTNARIRYKRVAEGTNREVDYDDVLKGYELPGDKFVTLTQDEVAAAELDRSRSIEITDFVDLAEVDPIYFEKSYYLAPRNESAHSPYALLRDAMQETGLAAVGTFVMRGKEYLAAIRAWKRVLVLETLLFADEVRDPEKAVGKLPAAHRKGTREMTTAISLIKQLTTPWKPEQYKDTSRARLLSLVKAKAKGKELAVEEPPPADENVIDLMDALQRSIDQAKGGRRTRSTARKSPAKRATSKRATSKRATSKRATAKRGTAKRATTKRAGTRKSASKRTTTKKSASKRTTTRKTAASKRATSRTPTRRKAAASRRKAS
jgi:DNA end-binding protein Ku